MRLRSHQIQAYVAAPLLIGAAVLVRGLVLGETGQPEPDILLMAVALAGMLGGLGPALLATVLGLLQEIYFHTEPVRTFLVPNHRDRVELGIYLLSGIATAVAFEVLWRLRRREQAVRRTLTMVTRCNEAILRAKTEEELLADVCRVAVEVGGYRMCWAGIAEADERRTIRPVAHAGHEDGYLRDVDIVWADEPRGRGPAGTSVREGRIVVGRDFAADSALEPWRAGALRRGYRSVTSIPVLHDGQVLAVVVFYSGQVAAFNRAELRFLKHLSADIAFGLDAIRQRQARDAAIDGRERAVHALAEQQERFQALIDHSTDVTLVIDASGIITFVSPSALTVLGLPPSEIVGRHSREFIHPEDQVRAAATLGALIDGREKVQRHELRIRRAGGGWATLESMRTAMLDHPAIRGIVVNSRDVTERTEATRRLQERERFLDLVLNTALDGFWVVDGEGRLLDVNPAYCAMSGYSREELIGKHISDLEAVERPEETAGRIQRLRERGFDQFETRQRRKNGTIIDVAAGIRFIGQDRNLMVGFFQDITGRKRSMDALRESEAWLRMSQEIARIGNYVYDVQKDHWSSSETLNQIFGIDASRARTGADWLGVVHPDDRPGMEKYLADLLLRGTRFDREYRVVDQVSGQVRWVHGLGELERSPDGTPVRLVGTIQDVTDRKVAEEGRLNLQAQLAHSARLAAMGTLVAGVAHEVNNPLTSLMASAGTALEEVRELQEDVRRNPTTDKDDVVRRSDAVLEMLVDVSTSAERISRIVKDLTILGRPEQRRERVRLGDVVKESLRWLPTHEAHRATIRTEIAEDPEVLASAAQLGQVVVNLVTNAVLAIPDGRTGTVVVRVGLGALGRAYLEVSDDGPGIPANLLARIFEPFFTTRRQGKGTGLGLSICNAIVSANGGTITVQSEVGKGATFRVELPAAAVEA